jgi:PEP-CTERM motif
MRKLLTILAILGLAVGISALSARADGVTYTVTSAYASDTSTTAVSAPGATFTFIFTVPSSCPPPASTCSVNAGFVDVTGVDVTFSSSTLPGFTALGTVSFVPSTIGSMGGLFGLTFPGVNTFDWEFMGPQIFSLDPTGTVATFLTGSFGITGSTGFPSPSGSFFADLSDPTFTTGGDLTGGSVTGSSSVSTPEPSSLLLLGSGFLAFGGFAWRRRVALFN